MSVDTQAAYLLRNEKTGLYLTVKGAGGGAGGDAAAEIAQEELHDWPLRAGQAWRLEPGQGGKDTYRIRNQHSGRYLQARRYSREAGAPVVQGRLAENSPAYRSQTWLLTNMDLHRFSNLHSGLWLNARSDVPAEGVVIDQCHERTGADRAAQQWHFEPVGPRGAKRTFDALAGLLVEPGPGGLLSTVTSIFKTTLEAGGGVFGTVSKWVPGADRTPYVRFDGFRGDEVVRFSQRNRIEGGPRKIVERFPHLPKEFHDGFDFVTATPRGSAHPYLGVKGDLAVEFSEKGSRDVPLGHYFPEEELGGTGRPLKAVAAAPDGSRYLVFGENGTATVDLPRGRYGREVRELVLEHVPADFRTPDTIASAAVGDETHFFATKGDQYLVFTFREVVQGPAKILGAYPFLLGLWS
ncbi:RICIN domain-containing protein [Streptomyces albireticuli]|uniref:RICIN domain-containing protein n=1 Tax=Streptomyces albireticuli TaxID=1940 RepID=UPI0036CC08D7